MKHPAKFSPEILDELRHQLEGFEGRILDPFAGAGGVHALQNGSGTAPVGSGVRVTYGIELEPEWAAMHKHTIVGDATNIQFPTASFDAVVTSPCYGNRMADKDMRASVASTYMKQLGREASAHSACHLQWTEAPGNPSSGYKVLHRAAWREANRVLVPGGIFLLNIKDHYRGEQRMKVSGWHVQTLQSLGMTVTDIVPVKTRHMKNGANTENRCTELVIRLEKA